MSVRLPIHRSINQRLEILGLGLWELGFLSCVFVALSEGLSFLKWGSAIAMGMILFAAGILRQLNRRYEPKFLLRLARFATLPTKLQSRMIVERKSGQSEASI